MLLARNQDRHTQHPFCAMALPSSDHAKDAPRFWELEALISAGCDLTEALTVISARREFASGERVRPAMAVAYQASLS